MDDSGSATRGRAGRGARIATISLGVALALAAIGVFLWEAFEPPADEARGACPFRFAGGAALVLATLAVAGLAVLRAARGTIPASRRWGRVARLALVLPLAALVAGISAPAEVERPVLRLGLLAAALGLALPLPGFSALARLGSTRAARTLDFLLFNLAVVLVLLEGGLSVAARFTRSPYFVQVAGERQADVLSRERPEQGTMRRGFPFNSGGFYDAEFGLEKDPDVFRIVALGDSFCVGIVPYELNFLTLLEEELDGWRRARGGGGVEILNMGIGGAEPQEYHYLYVTEGRRYEPDLVLVNFFVGNDVEDYQEISLLDPEGWYAFTVPSRMWRVWQEARRQGVAPGQVAEAGGEPALDPSMGDGAYHEDPRLEKPSISEELFYQIELSRLFICHIKREREYRDTFDILSRLAAAAGTEMAIVAIPDEYQVNDELYNELFRRNPGVERRKFDRERPQKELARFCGEEGIPYLDLLPALREAATREDLVRVYHLRNTHWNANGNRVAAREMAAFLKERIAARSGRDQP